MKNFILVILLSLFSVTAMAELSVFAGGSSVENIGNSDSKLIQVGANFSINDFVSIGGSYAVEESHDDDLIVLAATALTPTPSNPNATGVLITDSQRTNFSIDDIIEADLKLGRTLSSNDGRTKVFVYGSVLYSEVSYESGKTLDDVGHSLGVIATHNHTFVNAEYFSLTDDVEGVGINIGFNL